MMARQMMRGAAIALALGLTACSEEDIVEADGEDGRIASGEVLEGTISDAMIPLDELRSQAPPLRRAPTGQNDGAVEEAQAVAPDAEAPEEAAPVIAAEPVLETTEAPAPSAPAE